MDRSGMARWARTHRAGLTAQYRSSEGQTEFLAGGFVAFRIAALLVVVCDLAIPDLEPIVVLLGRRGPRPGDQLRHPLKLFGQEVTDGRFPSPIGPCLMLDGFQESD